MKNKNNLKNLIKNNISLIAFIGTIAIVLVYWSSSIEKFNNNIDKCGSNYCTIEK